MLTQHASSNHTCHPHTVKVKYMILRGNVVTPPQVTWVNITAVGMAQWMYVKHAPGGNIGNYSQYWQSSHLQ